MDLRILMISDDPCYIVPDVRLLKDKGFRVYRSFNYNNLGETIKEIKPHIIFFNLRKQSNMLEHQIDALDLSTIDNTAAVIYTVDEDDTYMVVQHASEIHGKSIILADSMVAAVKTALGNISYTPHTAMRHIPHPIHLYRVSA